MKLKYFQKGMNFSQDGPGNRLVYHLQGCNLRCPWCANPEGITVGGCLTAGSELNGDFCPRGAISGSEVDFSVCRSCSKPCLDSPASGMKMSCVEEEISDIVAFCESCKMMFFGGGGVTVSGGEPTVQAEGLREFFTLLGEKGINRALECNCTYCDMESVSELTDFLICDCKHYDSDLHKEVCGSPLDTVLENIGMLSRTREQLLIRIPLIGSFNAREGDAERFAELFGGICTDACSFEFLRYHEFGKNKYARCGMNYTMGKDAFVPPETVEKFTRIFREHSLNVIHT